MLNFDFLEKRPNDFSRKMFLFLYSIKGTGYSRESWKSTDKWSLICFKTILKILHFNYLQYCNNLPVKFVIFLKSSLLFNSFYCLFCLQTKLYGSITSKLEQLWMRKWNEIKDEIKNIFHQFYRTSSCRKSSHPWECAVKTIIFDKFLFCCCCFLFFINFHTWWLSHTRYLNYIHRI